MGGVGKTGFMRGFRENVQAGPWQESSGALNGVASEFKSRSFLGVGRGEDNKGGVQYPEASSRGPVTPGLKE